MTEVGVQRKNGHQRLKEASRRRIEDALFALMQEKAFPQITVSQIAAHADVARRTFYRLYQNKEDVICQYLRRICMEYQQSHAVLNHYDIRRIAEEYFCFWYQYKELILLLIDSGLEGMLYDEMRHASLEVVGNRIASEDLKDFQNLDCFADYSAGGFINLLRRWALDGMQGSPEQYAEKVSEAILSVIYDERI